MEKSIEELRTPTSKEEIASNLVLRLVDALVKKNRGITRFEVDETKSKKSIFLKFPVERRKLVYYEPVSANSLLVD
jgi:hypothetical protein